MQKIGPRDIEDGPCENLDINFSQMGAHFQCFHKINPERFFTNVDHIRHTRISMDQALRVELP
ncbi:hypothetical protein PF003_g18837 [Phytophthora fragariae]|nr:hypothetical protein PF003_g18837 [Phytophthora fragariae]